MSKAGARRQKAAFGVEESMIVQVIVHVGDEDRKGHAPPKFLNVGLRRGPIHPQGVDDFGIAVFLGANGLNAKERRGRHVHDLATDLLAEPREAPRPAGG